MFRLIVDCCPVDTTGVCCSVLGCSMLQCFVLQCCAAVRSVHVDAVCRRSSTAVLFRTDADTNVQQHTHAHSITGHNKCVLKRVVWRCVVLKYDNDCRLPPCFERAHTHTHTYAVKYTRMHIHACVHACTHMRAHRHASTRTHAHAR